MLRTQKADVVAQIKELFEKSGAYFITDYQGLNVANMTVLRKELRENNVNYLVAKNTLFRLAAKDAGVDGLDEYFVGPTAIAFANDDPSVAAKILHESYKKTELPRFKVFMVEGQLHQADEVKVLADLPSRDVLLSQVVAAVEAPFTELIGSLDGFFRELIGLVDALEEKKKGEG
ncbi:MAG: 50S ribosomal protein L10 [candidate division Zixibacteria bacterium]|nr:50S ribosomal protein L10 [candidate division Zixibacteria bacterium]